MTSGLSIVVVNWNTGELLRRCVDSIIAAPPSLDFQIVVVDNASTDDSLARLREHAGADELLRNGRMRIVENAENRGFGAANNLAFTLTRSPFVLLLNPDTMVTPGAIDVLLDRLRSDSALAACGPRLLNADGSLQISVWRNPPAAWEIVLSNLRLFRLLPARIRGELLLGPHWAHDRRRRVRMLSAAAMLVKREAIDAVGGFDERFHLYGEDNEWCLRLVRAGWVLLFEPAAVVRHDEARSTLARWTRLEKRQRQLEAGFLFQQVSLPRRHVAANQLALYLTAVLQRTWRKVRGADAAEMTMVARVHRRHLAQALRSRAPSGAAAIPPERS